MPLVRVYPGGTSGGFAGPGHPGTAPKRGTVRGWSAGSSRRLVAWLWSVDPALLADRDDGWALTLTMGGTPDNAQQWHWARKQLMRTLKRRGVELQHWVVEWTAKGRPHLHMAVYGPGRVDAHAVVEWLSICDLMGWPGEVYGQHIVRIDGVAGWLEYLAKHASRGVRHYQRQGMPEGWEKSGRLWGHWGDWPVELPVESEVNDQTFWVYRRHVRRYQKAKLRAVGAYRASRTVGKNHGDREKGRYAGVSGWIPEALSVSLLLASRRESPGEKLEREADYVSNHKRDR